MYPEKGIPSQGRKPWKTEAGRAISRNRSWLIPPPQWPELALVLRLVFNHSRLEETRARGRDAMKVKESAREKERDLWGDLLFKKEPVNRV
ncbi:Hypothetical protein NTJ_02011 [Nesidiocoris tenuis]|uniref:Uncharacterized protein n=1 Tax=Nesidiocoris tenuis TaxID=355587 RepID=A0ABN7AA55_9HEMI|nr:Hypothetical protein NTJ_02011 [Nesidiocoris tenuis]